MKTACIKQRYRSPDTINGIVFLDRDGTLISEKHFLFRKNQIHIYRTAIKAIRLFNQHNILVVVLTNQPIIARGWLKEKDVKRINDEIVSQLNKFGAYIHAVYTCPHHPNATKSEYRVSCSCRKPNTEMLDEAQRDFLFSKDNMVNCFIIGDRTTDIQMGINAGIRSILVKTGMQGKDNEYDAHAFAKAKTIYEAAVIITKLFQYET